MSTVPRLLSPPSQGVMPSLPPPQVATQTAPPSIPVSPNLDPRDTATWSVSSSPAIATSPRPTATDPAASAGQANMPARLGDHPLAAESQPTGEALPALSALPQLGNSKGTPAIQVSSPSASAKPKIRLQGTIEKADSDGSTP
jgi:hypothetical protein